ncbi:hypothetical protein AVEN_151850-1 [Araneus ventricosus]|uniref:Uncharacterized protein n=2 Tax=Araneus ventricosus TaxID=182803 RepID=A0A4Y2MNG6_ARAVE|nr:hypothetical protein AVEN_25847-1 [Araneus ventricosus]GBN28329.1 hypothetical protein AVEN_151850-1 [Araneus ventricosus]
MYDLKSNRPHTWRIFGSGLKPRALRPRSRDLTTRPPRPIFRDEPLNREPRSNDGGEDIEISFDLRLRIQFARFIYGSSSVD